MADTKITSLLTPQVTTNPATDVLPIVNIADTSMASSGSTRKITVNTLLGAGGTATLASATITGDLTVDTSTLKVDSANDRVGIGTATPAAGAKLSVLGSTTVNTTNYIGSSTWAAQFVGSSNGASSGLSLLSYSASGLPAPVSIHAFPVSDYRSALVATYSADAFGAGYFAVNRSSPVGSNTLEHYKIDNAGVATWSNVGGVAGTAMTLNSAGLGVGGSPSFKLDVNGDIGVSGNENYVYLFSTYSIGNNSRVRFRAVGAGGGSGYGGDFRISTRASNNSWNTDAMTLDASGNLLVGRTTQPYGSGNARSVFSYSGTGFYGAAFSNSTSGNGTAVIFTSSTGGLAGFIDTTNTTVTYGSVSDYRLKENVQPLTGGLARVNALKPSIYKWKCDGSAGEGFLAHELAEVVPAAVSGEKDAVNADGNIKPQGVDLSKVVPVLVAAIQELTARVQTLEAK